MILVLYLIDVFFLFRIFVRNSNKFDSALLLIIIQDDL